MHSKYFLKILFLEYTARPAGFLIMHFLLFELLTMSSLFFPLFLLRMSWECLDMIAGSSCISHERAREFAYLTKTPLVPGAHQAVELKKCF